MVIIFVYLRIYSRGDELTPLRVVVQTQLRNSVPLPFRISSREPLRTPRRNSSSVEQFVCTVARQQLPASNPNKSYGYDKCIDAYIHVYIYMDMKKISIHMYVYIHVYT